MKKMKDIYEAVISEPNMKITVNYEWRRHEGLAGNYPDGKAVYYRKEMAKLRETMIGGKINLIVASWIKSNFVITLFDDYNIFEYWDKINEKELMKD